MSRIAICCLGLVALVGCGRHRHGEGGPHGPGAPVAYATTSVNCNGSKFEISTGTSHGKCSVQYGSDGKALGGNCQDGANTSAVNCALNGDKGGCSGDAAGSGTCVER
jgi:hypothetical protein